FNMDPINILTVFFLIAMIAGAGITLAHMAADAAGSSGSHTTKYHSSHSSSSDITELVTTTTQSKVQTFLSRCNATGPAPNSINETAITLNSHDLKTNKWDPS